VSRLRSERGQASAELLGFLPYLLLVVLLIWQGLLAAWAFDQASNAARTASRVEGRKGDPEKAARTAVSDPLRAGMKVEMDGERATVRVRIPIIVPGLGSDGFEAKRSAELPS
jgi:hypothetical protein